MSRFSNLFVSLLFSVAAISAPAVAAPLDITFESLPGADGVLGTGDDIPMHASVSALGNEFASVGLTFSQGTLFQADFFDGNPDNHFISSTNPVGYFSVPVFGITISSKSFWDATLTAYDAADNIIGSFTAFNPHAGWEAMSSTLTLATSDAIHHFTVADSSNPDHILNLDNLVLDVRPAEVPEPAPLALFGIGLLALAQRYRRKHRV